MAIRTCERCMFFEDHVCALVEDTDSGYFIPEDNMACDDYEEENEITNAYWATWNIIKGD